MKIMVMVVGFVVTCIGVIGTLDWDSRAAELVRSCMGILFLLIVALSMAGCSALVHACRDGLCR